MGLFWGSLICFIDLYVFFFFFWLLPNCFDYCSILFDNMRSDSMIPTALFFVLMIILIIWVLDVCVCVYVENFKRICSMKRAIGILIRITLSL